MAILGDEGRLLIQRPTDQTSRYACDITNWRFSVDASGVDITAIGQKFGENVKDLIRGSGSIDWNFTPANGETFSPLELLQFTLETQNLSNAIAQFHVLTYGHVLCPPVEGPIYYEAEILSVLSEVQVAPTALISGKIDFITTGEFKLIGGDPLN